MLTSNRITATIGAAALMLTVSYACAQPPASGARRGTFETITVHGAALEGALEGDSADREVRVYLPPSYASESGWRYPVVYNLHGYSLTAARWVAFLGAPDSIDAAIASGAVPEMIIVMPDAMTLHGGSMYSASPTTGDWEAFIAENLVDYIDGHYRTLAKRASRGLMGHSMGGYGTLRIAMKYPEVWDSIYAMSACCLSARRFAGPTDAALEKIATVEKAQALGMGQRTTFAASAAWSPNPDNPPFYLNLPSKDGEAQYPVLADWAANAPHAMLSQYIPEMKSFDAIGLEVGRQDTLLNDNATMDALMTRFGIEHSFETYEGDHVNHIAERFVEKALPFFGEHLAFK
jgi:enterochelin esterase-like enzyme